MKRGSGVILPIFSLPHSYGIGSLGHEAYNFVEFLEDSNIRYWQLLPIGQTSIFSGNSPYSSISSFAGNPYFIDYDILFSEGLIQREDYIYLDNGNNYSRINYDLVDKNKKLVLKKAYETFKSKNNFEEIDEFFNENEFWLRDYCLYMTLRKRYGLDWSKWPKEYSNRVEKDLNDFWNENLDEINYYIFIQYEFFSQYYNLKKYANDKGIEIIGDIPIYVSFDSSDCWAYSKYFQLDDNFNPKRVSGAKPDAFNEEGQLWGHPLYDWEKLKNNNYEFWLDRIKYNKNLYDIIRLDHFIGFINYYAIEVGATSAKNGIWMDGPGVDLFNFLESNIDDLKLIVEDLGVLTNKVLEIKDQFNYPGMNVIQFAFSDNKIDQRNLPHNYVKNSAVLQLMIQKPFSLGYIL